MAKTHRQPWRAGFLSIRSQFFVTKYHAAVYTLAEKSHAALRHAATLRGKFHAALQPTLRCPYPKKALFTFETPIMVGTHITDPEGMEGRLEGRKVRRQARPKEQRLIVFECFFQVWHNASRSPGMLQCGLRKTG